MVITDSAEMNLRNTFIKLYKSCLAINLMSALELGDKQLIPEKIPG